MFDLSSFAFLCFLLPSAIAGGPGNYAHFVFPSVPEGADDMSHTAIWVQLPTASELSGNAVFAATQQWFLAGPGGYMGTQHWRNDDGSLTSTAIFSSWDADATHITTGIGANCSRFGGEGVGSHCLINITLRVNASYTVRVRNSGSNASGAFWQGTITDDDRKETTVIGTLFHPNMGGHIGYGKMQVAAASFQEYFLSSECAAQAVAGIGLRGPYFNNGSIVATQASPDYVSDCSYSNVDACIPGFPCGAPNVYMLGGGFTNQTVQKNTPLW